MNEIISDHDIVNVTIGFDDSNSLLTMKELRARFRRLVVEKHKGGSNEDLKNFVKLTRLQDMLLKKKWHNSYDF